MVNSTSLEEYTGEYKSKIVAGNRIVIPPAFRKLLGKEFVLTKGYEGSLILVDQNRWKELIAPLKSMSFLQKNLRDTLRFLVGSSFKLSTDSQGRVVVPESLRDHAQIHYIKGANKYVVFIGLINWIEVWDYDKWVEHSKFLKLNAENIADALNTNNIN